MALNPTEPATEACNFIKIETLAQVFSCEFCEISKYTFFHRTPLVAGSVLNYLKNPAPSSSRDMRNEIYFPSAPQDTSREQNPLRNTSQPKTSEKQSEVNKIIEVTDL